MSDLVEKVARAIHFQTASDDPSEFALKIAKQEARAAIAAVLDDAEECRAWTANHWARETRRELGLASPEAPGDALKDNSGLQGTETI